MRATAALRAAGGASRPYSPAAAVLVAGVRTPFALSGTAFNSLQAVDLARHAIKGLLTKTAWDAGKTDQVIMGTVIQEGEGGAWPAPAELSAGGRRSHRRIA
jgi:acetyl-CoA C-acetyltransferase